MQQVKLLKVYRNDNRKDGTPYRTKEGKPFVFTKIQFELDGKEQWASCCDFDGWTADFRSGELRQIKLERNKDFLNFKKTSRFDEQDEKIQALMKAVKSLDERVKQLEGNELSSDLPFG